MSWNYASSGPFTTGSSAGKRNILRRLLKDTSSGRQLFSNEELMWYSSQNPNIYRAAAAACYSVAAREGQSKTVGDLSLSGYPETYRTLGRQYERLADQHAVPFAGGILQSDKDARVSDTDRVVPAFARSLHDNPDTALRAST